MFFSPSNYLWIHKKFCTWISRATHFNKSQYNKPTVVYKDVLEAAYKIYWPNFIPITTTLKWI